MHFVSMTVQKILLATLFAASCSGATIERTFNWNEETDAHWLGEGFWTNRLQDWEVSKNNVICHAKQGLGLRTAFLTQLESQPQSGKFANYKVSIASDDKTPSGYAGLLIGGGGGDVHYKSAALIQGLPGIGGGTLAVFDFSNQKIRLLDFSNQSKDHPTSLGEVPYPGKGISKLILEVNTLHFEEHTKIEVVVSSETVPGTVARLSYELKHHQVSGLTALACASNNAVSTFQFDDLSVSGDSLAYFPERTFGPIVGALYSLADKTLKIGVQFSSLGTGEVSNTGSKPRNPRVTAVIEALDESLPNKWIPITRERVISPPDYHILFRIENWDDQKSHKLRVHFVDASQREHVYPITIRQNPTQADEVKAATFSCMGVMGLAALQQSPQPTADSKPVGRWTAANVWAPFETMTNNAAELDPDIIFFTGDQIYEGKPTWTDSSLSPIEDYLYKFSIWHWSFQELTATRPSILQTDDHDVYQANIWGDNGRINSDGSDWSGGYEKTPSFVNLVQKTMTAHNPDALNPINPESDIYNYYTAFNYGNVSFFVLEDRKFKSPPTLNDHSKHSLLGHEQESEFIKWCTTQNQAFVKCAVSQTIYVNITSDKNGLQIAERDTNSWPPGPRNKIVAALADNNVFLLSGDQHLATTAYVKTKELQSGFYQFAAPPAGNHFWRWFYPKGRDLEDILGKYQDASGNPFDLLTVANPAPEIVTQQGIRNKMSVPLEEWNSGFGTVKRPALGDGFGLLRFNHAQKTLSIEAYPWNANAVKSGFEQFNGWPVIVKYSDL